MRLFLAVNTQWRRGQVVKDGTIHILPVGLDYGALEVTARLRQIPMTEALFYQIQVMENAALKVFHESRD